MKRKILAEQCLGWNSVNWLDPMLFWEPFLEHHENLQGNMLEIGGSRKSILAPYFASAGFRCTTSYFQDKKGVMRLAKKYTEMLGQEIAVEQLDILNPSGPFQYNSICMKSVLGGISRYPYSDGLDRALKNTFHMLKPGGKLFLMENIYASSFHAAVRKRYGAGRKNWHYFTVSDLVSELEKYGEVKYRTYGFLGFADLKSSLFNNMTKRLDVFLDRLIHPSRKAFISAVVRKN